MMDNALSLISPANQQPAIDTALHYAALTGDVPLILVLLNEGYDINALDKFNCSPLEIAITHNHTGAALLMLNQGHLLLGGARELNFALQMGNDAVAQAIIYHPDFNGDLVGFRAFRWKQIDVLNYLVENQVNMPLTNTLLTVKMLAHRFSIKGDVNIYPMGYQGEHGINISLEGHYNQITAHEAFLSFQAYVYFLTQQSKLPDNFNVYQNTLAVLAFASTPHLTGQQCFDRLYESYLLGETQTLFVPSGWDGHAVGIVISGDLLFKCNRGLGSDGEHGIIVYQIGHFEGLTPAFFDDVIAAEGNSYFFLYEMDDILDLTEIARFEASPQTVGNCAWFSAIESIHAIMLAEFLNIVDDPQLAAILAEQAYENWQIFDLDYSILSLPTEFADPSQKTIIDGVLFKVVLSHHDCQSQDDIRHTLFILQYVDDPGYLITHIGDPTFHLVVSNVMEYYVDVYQHSSFWFDPLYFSVDALLDLVGMGYTEQSYSDYIKDVEFGESLNDLVTQHPEIIIHEGEAPILMHDIFPAHSPFTLDPFMLFDPPSSQDLNLIATPEYHF